MRARVSARARVRDRDWDRARDTNRWRGGEIEKKIKSYKAFAIYHRDPLAGALLKPQW